MLYVSLLVVPSHHMGYFLVGVHEQCTYLPPCLLLHQVARVEMTTAGVSVSVMHRMPCDGRQRVSLYSFH